MKLFIKFILLLCLFGFFSCKSNTNSKFDQLTFLNEYDNSIDPIFPKPIGFVNDFSSVFTISQKDSLENILSKYEADTTREVVIITVDSITPYSDLLEFGKDIGNEWGVGKYDKNNGLLIVLNQKDREIVISTGLGTEKEISDRYCQHIIDVIMIPKFKEKNYFGGILDGVNELFDNWM